MGGERCRSEEGNGGARGPAGYTQHRVSGPAAPSGRRREPAAGKISPRSASQHLKAEAGSGSRLLSSLPGNAGEPGSKGDSGKGRKSGARTRHEGGPARSRYRTAGVSSGHGRLENLSSNAQPASPPRAPTSTPEAEGTPNVRHRTSRGCSLGWAVQPRRARAGCRCPAAASPTHPEVNPPMDYPVGTCFHREVPLLWNTLCKNYSFI